jgi:hypothetical protein
MSQMVAIKKVVLNERHFLSDSRGKNDFPPYASLVIAQHPDDQGFFLLNICVNGQITDTWHATLEDALHQAQYEFDVKQEEWIETNEPL